MKFILDKDVNEELNEKLIQILSVCFPDQPLFKKQRYYKEMPQYRWYFEFEGEIVAHVALHDKKIGTEIGLVPVGGIAEVCVHPAHRGKGLAKQLLEKANEYSVNLGHKFSMLYGEKNIYSSSGYKTIHNKIKFLDHVTKEWKIEDAKDAMVKEFSDLEWPKGLIDINGPTF